MGFEVGSSTGGPSYAPNICAHPVMRHRAVNSLTSEPGILTAAGVDDDNGFVNNLTAPSEAERIRRHEKIISFADRLFFDRSSDCTGTCSCGGANAFRVARRPGRSHDRRVETSGSSHGTPRSS